MSFTNLLNTLQSYRREIRRVELVETSHLQTITNLLNDAFSDWLALKGIGRIATLDGGKLVMNVDGQLKPAPAFSVDGITLHNRFITVDVDKFDSLDEVSDSLEKVLACYLSEGDGAYVWVIPDGYMASLTDAEKEWEKHGGGYFSHESICVSNTADIDTRCQLEVLYEDGSKANVTCEFKVAAHQSVHYRLDKLKNADGQPLIAKDAPVSYKLTSLDARVVVQGSRILNSGVGSEFASFGTVMAWCPQQRRH